MFAKLKSSKWFKSLSEAFCSVPKGCANKEAVANSKKETAANPKTTEDSR